MTQLTARVYDITGEQRSWDWLRSIYGKVAQLRSLTDRGFVLAEVWAICDPAAGEGFVPSSADKRPFPVTGYKSQIKTEPSPEQPGSILVDPGPVIVVRVEDQAGQPLTGIPVART